MKSARVLLTALVAVSFSACHHCGHPGPGFDAGSPADGGDAGSATDSGSGTDAGSASDAGSSADAGGDGGSPTDAGSDGGSGTDAGTGPTGKYCGGTGAGCSSGVNCCSGHCVSNQCSAAQCLNAGQTCSTGSDCCTGLCAGTCQSLPAGGSGSTCGVTGQSCSVPGDCCSTLCVNGACQAAYSCQTIGDLCFKNSDCCGNACGSTDGGPARCFTPTASSVGTCTQGGNVCSSSTQCCSRICSDPGSGATVCFDDTGCRITGDSCSANTACCGGIPLNGCGPWISCGGTLPYGVCTNPSNSGCANCQPTGDLCGWTFPDGGKVQGSSNCCTDLGTSPNQSSALCKLDSQGMPRCFGGYSSFPDGGGCPTGYTGQAPCCISDLQQCQFKDQCCNGEPCLPNPDGGGNYLCQTAGCLTVGATCTFGSSSCCDGTSCQPTPSGSATGYACLRSSQTGCFGNGALCTTYSQCCSGICGGGVCQAPPACQPQGGTCTASADCCMGYNCAIIPGNASGTCQAGTCSQNNQQCTPSFPCCGGFCHTSSGAACDGTSPCTCSSG